jgi:hypothetical protein
MRARTHIASSLSALVLIAALLCPATSFAQAASAESSGVDEAGSTAQTDPTQTDPSEAKPELPASDDPLINEPSPGSTKRTYKQHSPGEKAYDVLLLRPWDLLGLVVSSVAFVPTALLCAPSGRYEVETALDILVVEPYENVFERRLGNF